MKKKFVSCFDIGEVPRSPGKWNWNWLYFLPIIFTFEQGASLILGLNPIVSRAKRKWYGPKIVRKLALNSHLLTVQILTNYIQVLILCLSYFVILYIFEYLQAPIFFDWIFFCWILSSNQMLFRAAEFEVPQIPFLPKEKSGGCHMFSQFCHLLYPNGIKVS